MINPLKNTEPLKRKVRKDWKKVDVKPNRTLWTKGDERFGDFIYIDKTNEGFEVSARNKINPKTIHGKFKIFKTESQALRFTKTYMKTH